MDARTPIEGSSNLIAFAPAFNLDCDMFVVGTNRGFKTQTDFVEGGVGLIGIVRRSNVVPIVGGSKKPVFNPTKVVVYDSSCEKFVRSIQFSQPVRGLRVLGNKLLVVLDHEVSIYDFIRDPKLEQQFTTTFNRRGLCAVSDTNFAILGQIPGHVKIVNNTTFDVSIIPAHSSELAAIALSRDGSLLATASEKGTLIRVFHTTNSGRVAELRRGVDQVAIFSLGFNPSGTMLACTSDKGTLHIFDIPHQSGAEYPPATATTGVPSEVGGGEWAYEESDGGVSHGYDNRSEHNDGSRGDGNGRWGVLGKIPFMPKYFRDTVSFANAEFALDDGPGPNRHREARELAAMGWTRLPRGTVGWTDENTVVVLGAGIDPKYERFGISVGSDGQRVCQRQAWANYLTKG
ncbi:wd repeat domain-containing phosphoinositide-interacting protein 4 [Ophiostoma piceae UAMH 11346]|uniref:Wd repeat domain-containing phosphoinositide-interacting protein 4 n=1 Tax=Ophiostoma piceae (strain UAMH 11346) TaxID=1262450 RepID=S3D3U1_OPHP1|nr:wd repeat domain-containing phosphoinositide-interacting protein 4 [Ophiostoma piceae UAMH 11346]